MPSLGSPIRSLIAISGSGMRPPAATEWAVRRPTSKHESCSVAALVLGLRVSSCALHRLDAALHLSLRWIRLTDGNDLAVAALEAEPVPPLLSLKISNVPAMAASRWVVAPHAPPGARLSATPPSRKSDVGQSWEA